jgi:nitrate reductase / nitrite oxidoreductase, alpha subunit
VGRLRLVGSSGQRAQSFDARPGGRAFGDRRRLLEGSVEVILADGQTVRCRPAFDLIREYAAHFDPKTTEELTWAPAAAVQSLARDLAKEPGTTLFMVGMGPNQFFNNDNKDRDIFLLAALTGNVGKIGGNVGSYAGNYRVALFNGSPQYINENPFDIELDPSKPARPKQYWRAESAHYYNHEDHPLKVGNRMLTGDSHMPAPTKSLWFANANSILGNVKWHYNTVINVLAADRDDLRQRMVVEHLVRMGRRGVRRRFVGRTEAPRHDRQRHQPVPVHLSPHAAAADLRHAGRHRSAGLGRGQDGRVDGRSAVQRLLEIRPRGQDGCLPAARAGFLEHHQGLRCGGIGAVGRRGIPALMNNRTLPKSVGYEQITDSRPWYTKTGRLEFYREEDEFIEAGENLPVHREPVDSTFYEPNVIVSPPHEALRPAGPEQYGVPLTDLTCDTRSGRNVVKTWAETKASVHPLAADGYRFVFHTPKYRHGSHTTPIDTDMVALLFGPFGDLHRRDKRSPFVNEGYVDIHPADAKALGIEDGDYVWIDSDPEDRPFRGFQENAKDYDYARLLCRARYYPGTPRGVTRMWFNMYGATPGSRADTFSAGRTGQERSDPVPGHVPFGLAPVGHARLAETDLDDRLAGPQEHVRPIGRQGLPTRHHCPTGAPREAIVKITKAEPGGLDGQGLWRPAELGIRPAYESAAMKKYLSGGFLAGDQQES